MHEDIEVDGDISKVPYSYKLKTKGFPRLTYKPLKLPEMSLARE